MQDDWVACPHCGESIKCNARACKHCGSDERTGWSQDTYLDGLDLPEPEDYQDGLAAEGFRKPPKVPGKSILAVVSALLILLFALWLLRGLF